MISRQTDQQTGKTYCRWHSPEPADREKHKAESRRGGLPKAYGALPAVSASVESKGVTAVDLETAEGLRGFLAATLQQLAHLPFDARTANSISSLATAQRSLIEASDFEKRLNALEAAQMARGLKRA